MMMTTKKNKRKILAVSGGIDSMVMMYLYKDEPGAVVAHFNHGTRPSADEDEEFVRREALRYGLTFASEKAALGEGVSEDEARKERYRFLNRVAREYDGEVYVAHQADDAIESMTINLLRGTGWRGMAVMGNHKVVRPMLLMPKRKVYQIADGAKLRFRQDPTNVEDIYLRNRVRERLRLVPAAAKERLGELRARQVELAREIDWLVKAILPEDRVYQRVWFEDLDDGVALEVLRRGLFRAGISATRPQILDFLAAIRSYAPEKSFNLPGGNLVKLHKTYFVL